MIRAKELFKSFRADPGRTLADLREAFQRRLEGKPGGISPREFSLRGLAEQFIVDDHGEPIGGEGLEAFAAGRLLESGAISTSAFAAITQRIVNAAVLEGYNLPDLVLSRAVPVVTGRTATARLLAMTAPLAQNKSLAVAEGQEKPIVGVYAEYVRTPQAVKKAARVPITREAVLADDTGGVLEAARGVGELIALEKESLLVDYLCGLVPNCVIEKRVTDSAEVASDMFLASGRWVNTQTNALADWTDIDDAENLLLSNTIPGTGQPPLLVQRFLLVPSQLRTAAFRILNATETRSGTSNVVASANPLAPLGVTLVASPLVYSRQVAAGKAEATAKGTWFYGDLSRACRYYQLWPLEVTEETNPGARISHDVIVEFSASENGTPVITEPRMWIRNLPT